MNDSTNVRIIADNIRKLEKMVKEAGSELPTPGAGDTGKILKVGSDGYELATEYSYTPPAYSSTDEVNTGRKWIDGKDIFQIVVTIPEDQETASPISKTVSLSDFNIGVVLRIYGTVNQGGRYYYGESDYRSANYFTNTEYDSQTKTITNTAHFSTGYYGGALLVLEYTKPEPTPEPTTSTKKTTRKDKSE